MGADHPIHPRSSQPADRSTAASAARNPYGLPTVTVPRFLANSALSQHCPPYLGSTPSGLLTGITTIRRWALHEATTTSASSIPSPQCVLSKAGSEGGMVTLHPRSAKVSITHRTRKCTDQDYVCISAIVVIIKASPRPAVDKPTQHLDDMPCGPSVPCF